MVTAVGPDVTEHQVGDHVGGFSASGCWGTFVTCDARLAVTLPPGLHGRPGGRGVHCVRTAWYGLHDLARIAPGDRVLIHSATGGVGQAAIAIARRQAPRSSQRRAAQQRRELLRDMGIEHVYDSRSTEFADLIRRDTDGYGVDIVLNSLTGAAQRAGLELLSIGGRFVEIGKRDVYGNTRLGLYPFRRNLTFYYVDLALMCDSHPQRIGTYCGRCTGSSRDGELPAPEHTAYPLAEAANAIRVMSAAEHTGKLVLSVPRDGRSSVVVPPERARVFRSDGAYIITGGLGGLGLFLAAGMAAAGCGRIVLTGRSQPARRGREDHCAHPRDRSRHPRGVRQHRRTRHRGAPGRRGHRHRASGARGVLHAAAVVEDATLTNITDELIDRDWAPKVYGAWHLHHATAAQPLDWFCCFSSAAALLGSPGQGAYAAANSWLDGFTHWRRAQGLPATAIAWGAWAEIGRGPLLGRTWPDHDDHSRRGRVRLPGAAAPRPRLHRLRADHRNTVVDRARSTQPVRRSFPSRRGRPKPTATRSAPSCSTLSPEEWPTRLRRLVAEQVSLILRRTVDPDRPFADHGLDSLGNLELRTHIETETGIRMTPKAIATHNTVRALAQHLSDTLAAEQTA